MLRRFYNFFWGDIDHINFVDITYVKKERLFLKLSFIASIIISLFIVLNFFNHKIFAMWFDMQDNERLYEE